VIDTLIIFPFFISEIQFKVRSLLTRITCSRVTSLVSRMQKHKHAYSETAKVKRTPSRWRPFPFLRVTTKRLTFRRGFYDIRYINYLRNVVDFRENRFNDRYGLPKRGNEFLPYFPYSLTDFGKIQYGGFILRWLWISWKWVSFKSHLTLDIK